MDPNPARGMPLQLQRFWLTGKGAAKIRWRMPHDFYRCVRNLRKYFPKNPEGLCNILHQKAVGAPPGKGHPGEHSLTASVVHEPELQALVAAAEALLAAQPVLGEDLWAGPLAPINRPTGEPGRIRIFEPGSIDHRVLPLPLAHRRHDAMGHQGAVTVGRIIGTAIGPDHEGQDWVWGWGDWFDANVIPEVTEAKYLVEMGVAGASLDPGGRVVATVNPETGAEHMLSFTLGGATLVRIPAFDMKISSHIFNLSPDGDWPDDDPDMDHSALDMEPETEDCGCTDSQYTTASEDQVFTVNQSGWRGLPLAPRESVFDNDDAVKRITAWAGGGQDVEKMNQAFMWRNPQGNPQDPTTYRLPVGDIVNGRLTLIFHAIYAAAALISGAHGGLPDIPDQDKNELRNVISEIYPEMAKAFDDSSIRAPWDRPANVAAREDGFAMADNPYPLEPPKAWFENPNLSTKTPLTVEPNGRVYGHLAAWGECHRDVTQRECVLAPRSRKDYAPFHLGRVFTAEGDSLPVGKIVMDTRHADINLRYSAAAIHYDNTGDEVAVVRAGEDDFGIWVAGALIPEVDARKAAKLRRSPLSGDWRAVDGNLELTAALAVNVPAFPVYAMDGEETRLALVAAGQVFPEDMDLEEIEDQDSQENFAMDEEQEDRGWALRELLDEDDQYEQWLRATKFAAIVAEDGDTPPEVSNVDPIYGEPAMLARQMDAQYTVIEDPEGGPEDDGVEPEPLPDTGGDVVAMGATAPVGAK